jgi:hypothetical protein
MKAWTSCIFAPLLESRTKRLSHDFWGQNLSLNLAPMCEEELVQKWIIHTPIVHGLAISLGPKMTKITR